MEFSREHKCLTAIVFLFVLASGLQCEAANTVDPNNTGATDVVVDPNSLAVILTNPVADPLVLSEDLAVGNTSSGILLIDDGSEVAITGKNYIGYGANSMGTVTVTDPNSELNLYSDNIVDELQVGHKGNGTLNILNGGTVSNFISYLADSPGSVGTANVDGEGSFWNTDNILYVGHESVGTLNVTGSGSVSSSLGYVGLLDEAIGMANISGSGSNWTVELQLYVGFQGNGTMQVDDGGTVFSAGGVLGLASDASGLVTVEGAGSSWINSGELTVGDHTEAALNILGGSLVSNTTGHIGYESGSTGTVLVDCVGSVWRNTADLQIGNSGTGDLTIVNSGLVSVGGRLNIDVDADGDDIINMATGGMLALVGNGAGSLTDFLSLVEGSDAIRYWDEVINGWSPITSGTNGVDYTLEYLTSGDLAGYTLLTVGEFVSQGDFNCDGVVDGKDFFLWQRDPSVGKLADWQANYGMTVLAGTTTVPEPSALLLSLFGAGVFIRSSVSS